MMSTGIFLYYSYLFLSVAVLIYAFIKDRQQLSIKWDGIAKFVGFMSFVTMGRLCLITSNPIRQNMPFEAYEMFNFVFVVFEDMFFVMIPYYIAKKINNDFFKFIVWVIFSSLFAYGHIYQGYFVALITGFYPYFISRKYAMKTSFVTVMMCHFMYDCITFVTVKFAKILHYL